HLRAMRDFRLTRNRARGQRHRLLAAALAKKDSPAAHESAGRHAELFVERRGPSGGATAAAIVPPAVQPGAPLAGPG
ncbi:MAG TPA: hypothetical protein VGV10_00605, partial [Thermoleophilaceae bacterium]|nr:hypothetical protein [Thermoleophilaceae bacterium]